MTDKDVLLKVKETIREELGRCANEEIDKLIHKFECELGKHKAEIISKMMNRFEIMVTENPLNREITFQINVKGGGKNDR